MKKNRYHRANLFVKFGDERYEKTKEEVMKIELEFIKKFKDTARVEHLLNNCSTGVLNFYLDKMGRDNRISNYDYIREEIRDYIVKVGGKKYAPSSIISAIKELSQLRIILSSNTKGIYYVNPLLYSKTNEAERKQLILDLTRDSILFESDFKEQ